jgi:hypothetical protein
MKKYKWVRNKIHKPKGFAWQYASPQYYQPHEEWTYLWDSGTQIDEFSKIW